MKPKKSAAKQVEKLATKKATREAAKRPTPKGSPPPASAGRKAKPPANALVSIVDSLRRHPKNRPSSVKALSKWLVTRKVAEADVESVISQLESGRTLRVQGKKIAYLDDQPAGT